MLSKETENIHNYNSAFRCILRRYPNAIVDPRYTVCIGVYELKFYTGFTHYSMHYDKPFCIRGSMAKGWEFFTEF